MPDVSPEPSISVGQADSASAQTVGDVMSRRVVTVTMDDTLARVRELFAEFGFHHLLVVQQGELLGVISDRDLLKAISPYVDTIGETLRDRATLKKHAHQIMSRRCVTVTPDTTIGRAARLLIEARVSCLPVVATDRTLQGIISWRDVIQSALAGLTSHQ